MKQFYGVNTQAKKPKKQKPKRSRTTHTQSELDRIEADQRTALGKAFNKAKFQTNLLWLELGIAEGSMLRLVTKRGLDLTSSKSLKHETSLGNVIDKLTHKFAELVPHAHESWDDYQACQKILFDAIQYIQSRYGYNTNENGGNAMGNEKRRKQPPITAEQKARQPQWHDPIPHTETNWDDVQKPFARGKHRQAQFVVDKDTAAYEAHCNGVMSGADTGEDMVRKLVVSDAHQYQHIKMPKMLIINEEQYIRYVEPQKRGVEPVLHPTWNTGVIFK